jgi:lipopolysaccharide/colanic/teichoic acid biosynthesis glycosyltransferase
MFHSGAKSIDRMLLAGSAVTLPPLSFASPPAARFPGWKLGAKRGMDVMLAAILLLVACLPMLLIALLIRLESPGPPLFRQRRIGQDGRCFVMWKFRTLRAGASADGPLCQVRRGDKRVTRLGAWLRGWSVDELPQLFNVLRGEMSLVGPRPHAPGTCAGDRPFELICPSYAARHVVRPGMTGLAQVRGWRGATETEDKLLRRVDADLEYIETWSLWLDLAILARTLAVVLHRCNAY